MINPFANVKRICRRSARRIFRTSGIFFLTLLTIFYSFGGLDFYLGFMTPFAPRGAEAAYTGKHLRTVEFVLGGGTDTTSRASNLLTYGGTTWNTVKATAGTRLIALQGSGIEVKNAYVDVSYILNTAVNLTNENVYIDVGGSSSGGTDARVSEYIGASLWANSGLSGYQRHQYDVTAFFDRQGDASFNAGIPVVIGTQITGPTRALTTVKLVITYEENYSLTPHTETKTVRFPLSSMVAGDRGTRSTACAAASTCSFLATSTIPDGSDGNIIDVYVEIHGETDNAVASASTFQIGIQGGTGGNASSTAYAWTETLIDDNTKTAIGRPTVGATNFQSNITMKFNVLTGTIPMNALGGELVITYNYSTGAAVQTETVRYFMDQETAAPGTTRNNFATTSMVVSNGGLSMQNIWFKIHTAPVAANTFTTFGKVGTSTEVTRGIAITAANPRSGDDHNLIFDMSDVAGNFFTAATDVTGATQFSAGGAPPGVEAYFTFTWAGSAGGPQTQTVSFSGAQQGVNAITGDFNNRPAYLYLPETVTKTYRSAYLETKYMHSQGTSITVGTVTIGVNGSSTVVTESADTTSEAYASTYFAPIASSTFSDGNTILWTERTIEISEGKNVANLTSFANMVVVTYDADFSLTQDTPPVKHLRTVEFVLGGGTDTTSRTTATVVYGGATWNTVKATAGTRLMKIQGSGIAVKNAYLDVSYVINTAANVTNENVFIDVGGSSSGGTNARISELLGASLWAQSGLSGYQRHQYDVTAFFDRQGDARFNAGIPIVTSISVTGPSHSLTTVRLVVTYEENFSLVPHTETKTVRFPLSSMVAGDRGTRSTACAAATTCSFLATSTTPDAVADADIVDVYVEIHGETDTVAAASTFQNGIPGGRGGNATSTAYNWTEALTDDNTKTAIWRPTVGSPNFQRNATMKFNVLMGTIPMNALGGELVVTYNYSTGAAAQTETVRYFMNQDATSTPGNARSEFPTTTMTISNTGLSMQNVWFKAHVAATSTANITIYGKVGTSSEVSRAITIGGVNPRSGDDFNLIFDLSDKAENFFTAATAIAGAEQYTAGAAPMAVEVYFTFTWSGKFGGPQTQTVTFSAAQQGLDAIANDYNNRPAYIDLPETVTKTYRSAYLETKFMHSQATNIAIGNLTIGVNGSSTVVQESVDTNATLNEAYVSTYFAPIASSTFSNGNTILWNERVIEINESKSQANLASFANIVVVTYDANQELLVPTFTQNYFRLYQDNGALTPTVAWPSGLGNLGENAEITAADNPPANGDRIRLRMSLKVATTTMTASSTQFNLQFAQKVTSCGAVASWTDLGAPASGVLWRGYNAPTITDGAQLAGGDPPPGGTVLLSVSDSAGTYQESNPTAVNPFSVIVGNDVEYDWNIQSNNAATNTPSCFRMTKSDGSALFSYDFSPVITTRGFMPEEKKWHWYDDETSANPSASLSGEGEIVAPSNVANGNTIKLRLTINETNASMGPNQKFRLQFSTYSDFSTNVNYVESTSTCVAMSQWCYGNGVDTNNDPITARVLSDSAANGTHNESATNTTTFYAPASTATEYEFTIIGRRAYFNTTYFFRAYDVNHNRPVPLAALASYPSLSVEGTTLSFSISGLATSTVTEGGTTAVGTTPTQTSFMTITPGTGKTAAQQLSVTTNAENGYQVFLGTDGRFTASVGDIPDVESTNAVPLDWATACPGTLSGCFGYHAGDDTLGAGSTRFLMNDTYAPFASTTLEEVMYNSGPVTADVANMVYRLDVGEAPPAGSYSVRLIYLVVPTF